MAKIAHPIPLPNNLFYFVPDIVISHTEGVYYVPNGPAQQRMFLNLTAGVDIAVIDSSIPEPGLKNVLHQDYNDPNRTVGAMLTLDSRALSFTASNVNDMRDLQKNPVINGYISVTAFLRDNGLSYETEITIPESLSINSVIQFFDMVYDKWNGELYIHAASIKDFGNHGGFVVIGVDKEIKYLRTISTASLKEGTFSNVQSKMAVSRLRRLYFSGDESVIYCCDASNDNIIQEIQCPAIADASVDAVWDIMADNQNDILYAASTHSTMDGKAPFSMLQKFDIKKQNEFLGNIEYAWPENIRFGGGDSKGNIFLWSGNQVDVFDVSQEVIINSFDFSTEFSEGMMITACVYDPVRDALLVGTGYEGNEDGSNPPSRPCCNIYVIDEPGIVA